MSKVTNYDLTRSGTRCFIAVTTVGVKGLTACDSELRTVRHGTFPISVI